MNKTRIEWCDYTWNPVTGCLHGCPYCYARKVATRFGGLDGVGSDGLLWLSERRDSPYPAGFMPTLHRYRLEEPAHKTKGVTIFVCSMADLFGDWVPEEWIERVFTACQNAPQHNYIFLTKNPQMYEQLARGGRLPALPNFWYGNSITSQDDAYIPNIHANRLLSIEPLLRPLKLYKVWNCHICQVAPPQSYGRGDKRHLGHPAQGPSHYLCGGSGSLPDWVIIGAESGNRKGKVTPSAEWVEALAAECKEYRIPVFMKDSIVPIIGDRKLQRELPAGLSLLKDQDGGAANGKK